MSIKMVMGRRFLHMHLTCHGKKLVDVTFMSIFGEYFLHVFYPETVQQKFTHLLPTLGMCTKYSALKALYTQGGYLGFQLIGMME